MNYCAGVFHGTIVLFVCWTTRKRRVGEKEKKRTNSKSPRAPAGRATQISGGISFFREHRALHEGISLLFCIYFWIRWLCINCYYSTNLKLV